MAVGIYKSNHTERKIRYFVPGEEKGLCWSLVWVVLGFFSFSEDRGERKTLERRQDI